jgi:hypothetical protein
MDNNEYIDAWDSYVAIYDSFSFEASLAFAQLPLMVASLPLPAGYRWGHGPHLRDSLFGSRLHYSGSGLGFDIQGLNFIFVYASYQLAPACRSMILERVCAVMYCCRPLLVALLLLQRLIVVVETLLRLIADWEPCCWEWFNKC